MPNLAITLCAHHVKLQHQVKVSFSGWVYLAVVTTAAVLPGEELLLDYHPELVTPQPISTSLRSHHALIQRGVFTTTLLVKRLSVELNPKPYQ